MRVGRVGGTVWVFFSCPPKATSGNRPALTLSRHTLEIKVEGICALVTFAGKQGEGAKYLDFIFSNISEHPYNTE
jgi:hypothetical protein